MGPKKIQTILGKGITTLIEKSFLGKILSPPLLFKTTVESKWSLPPSPKVLLYGDINFCLNGFLAGISRQDVPFHNN